VLGGWGVTLNARGCHRNNIATPPRVTKMALPRRYFFGYNCSMSEPNRRPRGRPRGRGYGVVKSVRFTEGDDELLAALARERGCSEAAVLRQLLRNAAKEAGISVHQGR